LATNKHHVAKSPVGRGREKTVSPVRYKTVFFSVPLLGGFSTSPEGIYKMGDLDFSKLNATMKKEGGKPRGVAVATPQGFFFLHFKKADIQRLFNVLAPLPVDELFARASIGSTVAVGLDRYVVPSP